MTEYYKAAAVVDHVLLTLMMEYYNAAAVVDHVLLTLMVSKVVHFHGFFTILV